LNQMNNTREARVIQEREWHTVPDLAEQYALHPGTILRWIDAGDLEAQRLGRQWRVHRDAWARFLERGRSPQPA